MIYEHILDILIVTGLNVKPILNIEETKIQNW